MPRIRTLSSLLLTILILALALPSAGGAARAQAPQPTLPPPSAPQVLHLPLVSNEVPAGLDTDLAYTVRTTRWWRTDFRQEFIHQGRQLGELGAIRPSTPIWHPDGERLLVAITRERTPGWDTTRDVYVLDTSGGVTNLTNSLGIEESPAWSADGQLLAYIGQAHDTEPWGLVVAEASGANPHRLDLALVPQWFAWSPKGQQIAYLSWVDSRSGDLRVVNADGSGDLLLVSGLKQHTIPTWSPDGAWLAYVDSDPATYPVADLRLVSADGTRHALLAQDMHSQGGISWAPDGSGLAYWLYDTDAEVQVSRVVDADQGLDLTLIGCPGAPYWSPDGRYVAYNSRLGITVIHPDGTVWRTLDAGLIRAWSPDGRYLAFVRFVPDPEAPDMLALYVVQVNAPAAAPRLVAQRVEAVAWRPR